ncbi:MAG: long-chain fatty acid--CoA ligase [Chloroflexota bacterium]
MDEKPWLKKYDRGVPAHIDYPDLTVFGLLESVAKQLPDAPCTIFKGALITYKQMDQITDCLAAGLAELGVKKGDRVGLYMPNIPQFIMAFYAASKIGAVVVCFNSLYTAREVEYQAKDSGIEVMILSSNFYKLVKQIQSKTDIRTIVVTNLKETLPPAVKILFTLFVEKKGGHRVELASGDVWMKDLFARHKPEDRPNVVVTPDDFAILQYSGGTTGVPKGAIGLHRNMVANAYQLRTWMADAENGKEVFLMAIPLFHVYGLIAGMMFALCTSSVMVMVPNPRDIKDLLKNLQKYRATVFPGVPTLFNAINHHPDVRSGKVNLRTLKACICGSAPLMRETKEDFEKYSGVRLMEGYGLSETPTATHCNPELGEHRVGSIGLPLPDVECRIVDLDDGVTDLPVGSIGELLLKAPQVFHGYHNMPTETANALRDGWLYTGDIARMDEDGFFYIVDRKKELIKPGGYQVWPREVEEVISAHPKVREVGVAGVPDPYRGETVKAWIVSEENETLTIEEIVTWCKDRMAKYKVPTEIEFRSELPKTTVGKVLRRELVRQHKGDGS